MKITMCNWYLNNGFTFGFYKNSYTLSTGIETGYAVSLGWWILDFTVLRKNR